MRKVIVSAFLLAFILVPAIVSHAAVDINTAVGVWLFDDGAGDVAKDSTSNQFDGQIAGAVWGDGKFGKALTFDGKSNVTVESDDKLNISKDLTLVAYFNATDLNDYRVILVKNNQYLMRIDNPAEGNKMSTFINLGGWEPRASAIVPDLNKWIHYAAVYDSTAKKITIYVNGEVQGEVAREGSSTPNTDAINIGSWGTGSYFVGTIDDVGIFNVALSAADVKSISDNGLKSVLSLDTGTSSVSPSAKLIATWGDLKRP